MWLKLLVRAWAGPYSVLGMLSGLAYLLSSLFQLLRGRCPYRDNAFEREAYAKAASPGCKG